jgi:hypothetical protein
VYDPLPESNILNSILVEYVEENRNFEDMIVIGFNRERAEAVMKLVGESGYERGE